MVKPIRVLQVIGSMNRGGAEAMLMNLYRNIDRERVQFDFIENTDKEAAFDEEIRSMGGKIYNCPHYTGKNHIAYVRWWKSFFREHSGEYRIIHGHIGSTAAIYLHEAKKAGLFTIAHSHNSGTAHDLRSMLYYTVAYPTRYIADYFMACSTPAGRDRFGRAVVESANYNLLHNAIDTSDFCFDSVVRESVRKEFGFEDRLVIGHIGRFNQQKNHGLLLRVFREIYARDSRAVLLMVGDGTLRDEMEQLAEQLGIAGDCVFAGVRTDVHRIIQAMDVLVFPSLFEGLPVTLVEAQTSGIPSVISDKVPEESILVQNCVTVMPLEASPQAWAEHILERMRSGEERYDRTREITEAGFDIQATAKWLEDFYCDKQ